MGGEQRLGPPQQVQRFERLQEVQRLQRLQEVQRLQRLQEVQRVQEVQVQGHSGMMPTWASSSMRVPSSWPFLITYTVPSRQHAMTLRGGDR